MTGSTEFTIAIITATTSLVVAVIGIIIAVINNRQTAWAAIELEKLKHQLASAETSASFGDEYLNASLKSLKEALQSIQRVKDEIQLILSAIETSLDTPTALKRFTASRSELFTAYEQELACLNEPERRAFHRAKNLALKIENYLLVCLGDKQYAAELSSEDRLTLRELRNELSDLQYVLRDSRVERLSLRTGQNEQ